MEEDPFDVLAKKARALRLQRARGSNGGVETFWEPEKAGENRVILGEGPLKSHSKNRVFQAL
jgi:hypothetical protein